MTTMASTRNVTLTAKVDVYSNFAGSSDILLLSDQLTKDITFATFAIICTIIAAFGIPANIINIIVFFKQGFNDTIVVSLFTLAIVDLCSLIILVWLAACYNPGLRQLDLPFNLMAMAYLTGGAPKHYFTRVAAWITSLVAIERCCCVLKPMTVRFIFTKRRIVVAIIFIFIGSLLSLVPLYVATRLKWKFDPSSNRTMLGLFFTKNRFKLDQLGFGAGVTMSLTAFSIVTSCTFILGWSLVKQSRWRAKAQSSGEVNPTVEGSNSEKNKKTTGKSEMSTKDKQAVRTVTFIAAMYVVCLSPYVLNLTFMCLFTDFTKGAKYKNLYEVAWSIAQTCESLCSSLNIFVYYMTSTKYKETFIKLVRPNLGK